MNKRKIRFVGVDKKGRDFRLLEVGYDIDKEKYRITILSATGKTLASVQLPRNEIVKPLKWLNRSKDRKISSTDFKR